MILFSPSNVRSPDGTPTGRDVCDRRENCHCEKVEPPIVEECIVRTREGSAVEWPNLYYVVGLDCNGNLEECPVMAGVGNCNEWGDSLCPSDTASQQVLIARPGPTSNVTHWASTELSTDTGEELWWLEESGGNWILYAGGKSDPAAVYQANQTPHRFRLTHFSMGSYYNCPEPAKLCAEFTLTQDNGVCGGWPQHIVIFGCFCETEQRMCRICHDCDWDDTGSTECCIFDFNLDRWEPVGCTVPPHGGGPMQLQSGSTVSVNETIGYPACTWVATGGSGTTAWTALLYLYYDKGLDRYKLYYLLTNDVFQTKLWEGESAWFARERCHEITNKELNRLDGTSDCSSAYFTAVNQINCPSDATAAVEMRRGKPVVQKGRAKRR